MPLSSGFDEGAFVLVDRRPDPAGALCEKTYLAKSDPKWEGILKGGVYHVHKGLGVDESVMWGEFFFCEALERVLW